MKRATGITSAFIKFRFTGEDWDACRGTRKYEVERFGLLVSKGKRELLIVQYFEKIYFFPIVQENDDGTLKYKYRKIDVEVPARRSDITVIKKLEFLQNFVDDIFEVADGIEKFMNLRSECGRVIKRLEPPI